LHSVRARADGRSAWPSPLDVPLLFVPTHFTALVVIWSHPIPQTSVRGTAARRGASVCPIVLIFVASATPHQS
jgi:hypothetical protein